MKNKHGLSRTIPPEIKLQVRKKCGFGCVICGDAFYHYDHYNPEFSDAKNHSVDGITLLCAKHHDDKTRGRLSESLFLRSTENPFCMTNEYSRGNLDFGINNLKIQIGSIIFSNSKSIVNIDGDSIFSVRVPDEGGGPLLLTLVTDSGHNGNKIVDNEWFGDSRSWDITTEGRSIVVKDSDKNIVLHLENIPDEKLIIHNLNIEYKGIRIETHEIKNKKIGTEYIDSEKVFLITNRQGLQIARIGSNLRSLMDIDWENAIDIEDEYIKASIDKIAINNGNLYLLPKPNSPAQIGHINLSSTNFSFGVNPEIDSFVKEAKELDKIFSLVRRNVLRIDTKRRKKFINDYKILTYKRIIEQIPEKLRLEINVFVNMLKNVRNPQY